MSGLKLVISATVIIWAGFESSQTATATQFSVQSIVATTHSGRVIPNDRSRSVSGREYLSLAKKCTLKRYRRPH